MILDLQKPAALVLAGAISLGAQNAAGQGIADDLRHLMSTTDYREVVIAPDHRHLAWVQAVPGTGGDLTIGTSIRIGATGGLALTLPDEAPIGVTELRTAFESWFPAFMEGSRSTAA